MESKRPDNLERLNQQFASIPDAQKPTVAAVLTGTLAGYLAGIAVKNAEKSGQ